MTAVDFSAIQTSLVGYLEGHAAELGAFLVKAAVAWVRDRRKAEAAIERLHEGFVAEFDAAEQRMKDHGSEP